MVNFREGGKGKKKEEKVWRVRRKIQTEGEVGWVKFWGRELKT